MSDRFDPPKPSFPTPKDNGLLSPKDQSHHTPSPSLVVRAELAGKDKIAALLAQAREDAKKQAKIIETTKKTRETKPAMKAAEKSPLIIEIDDSFIVSDDEFIKRTRAGNGFNIHDEEVQKLFYANGGIEYLQDDVTYGTAFENLRRAKLHLSLFSKENVSSPYSRIARIPQGTKRWITGVPSQSKMIAENEAKNRKDNSHHYGFVQPARRK